MTIVDCKDQISELFFPQEDLLPEVIDTSTKSQEDNGYHETLELDFDKARTSINSILDTSELALDRLMDVVRDTDSPRAFEVAATLISTISMASKDLLELHEKLHRLKEKSCQSTQPVNQTNIQNNIAFKGTSKDLLELIKMNS